MMLKTLNKLAHNVGRAPGSVIYYGEYDNEPVSIDVMHVYPETSQRERRVRLQDATAPHIGGQEVRWIDVFGVHNTTIIKALGSAFDLHSLTLEDIVNPEHRAKVEVFDEYIYVVLRVLWLKDGVLQDEQISFILRDKVVLSLQERHDDLFDPLRERLNNYPERFFARGSSYLLYSMIDIVVDTYLAVLEHYTSHFEDLEDNILLGSAKRHNLEQLTDLRRELIIMRRALSPLSSMVQNLADNQSPLLEDHTRTFLRDVMDHSGDAVDSLTSLREQLSNLHELYVTNLNIKMNEVMQVLTVISTIFIPLSFLVGVYGMNFEVMPELSWDWGYFALWGLMMSVAVGMLVMFRRNDWL
jgi:magnesium transporter